MKWSARNIWWAVWWLRCVSRLGWCRFYCFVHLDYNRLFDIYWQYHQYIVNSISPNKAHTHRQPRTGCIDWHCMWMWWYNWLFHIAMPLDADILLIKLISTNYSIRYINSNWWLSGVISVAAMLMTEEAGYLGYSRAFPQYCLIGWILHKINMKSYPFISERDFRK